MKRKGVLLLIIFSVLITSCNFLVGTPFVSKSGEKPEGQFSDISGYKMISVEELDNLMNEEEITLINVHIPLEGNIPETDLMIPFNDIENYKDQLPQSKYEKIVIYCRSGGMGDTASETLVKLGYANVWNLDGGYNVWRAVGLPFEE